MLLQAAACKLAPAVHLNHDDVWVRRDVLGVHQQKQVG